MSKFKNVLGASSGKIGAVVTYEMYGKSYMRAMPSEYKDAKSEKQLAQREKMKLVLDFQRPFTQFLRLAYKEFAVGRSAFQAAQSHNLKNAITGEYPNLVLNPSKALISKGDVVLPLQVDVKVDGDKLHLKWDNNGEGKYFDNLVVVSNSNGTVDYLLSGMQRGRGEYTMDINHLFKPFQLWISFRDAEEKGFSNSMYLGKIE